MAKLVTADWEKVQDVLNFRPTTETAPHPGDSTALIPHTLISVLQRLRNARLALSQMQRSVNKGEAAKNVPSIGPSLIRDVTSAVQELNRHFEKILSNKERLSYELRGPTEDSVIWIEPSAQQDFVDFIAALWKRYDGSPCSREDLSELVEWALKTDVNDIFDNTGVERAAEACRSVKSAFDTFQKALDKMLEVQEELSGPDHVAVN